MSPICLLEHGRGLAQRIPYSVVALVSRVAVASVFWRSGQTKVAGFSIREETFALFRDVYKVPLLPPDVAAYLSTIGEHVFSVLLVVGLASRLSAIGLLFMTAVIELFIFPDGWPEHILWTGLLLQIIASNSPSPSPSNSDNSQVRIKKIRQQELADIICLDDLYQAAMTMLASRSNDRLAVRSKSGAPLRAASADCAMVDPRDNSVRNSKPPGGRRQTSTSSRSLAINAASARHCRSASSSGPWLACQTETIGKRDCIRTAEGCNDSRKSASRSDGRLTNASAGSGSTSAA